jgi:cystathionine gamma-synthase
MEGKARMDDRRIRRSIETRVARGSKGQDPVTGAVSFPIYQTATFRHPGLGRSTGFDYSRQENPTRRELEETMASLESGSRGFAFGSGMAAISAVFDLLSAGDRVLLSEDLYGGSYRIAQTVAARHGIASVFVDTRSLDSVAEAWSEGTRLLLVETPSNPMARVSDIGALADFAHGKGALLAVDNTFLSPLFQRPLELGADIVVHSATKFLGGHNDTVAGIAVVAEEGLGERLFEVQRTTGGVLGPFDSWLILRGIKTLALRMVRQERSAMAIAAWLEARPEVAAVYYAGSPDHPQRELSLRQCSGFGSMISFRLAEPALAGPFLERLGLVLYAESLGGAETLITYPILQTHASVPKELRDRLGVDEGLLRLSVGIEAAEDLIEDLGQAFEESRKGTIQPRPESRD